MQWHLGVCSLRLAPLRWSRLSPSSAYPPWTSPPKSSSAHWHWGYQTLGNDMCGFKQVKIFWIMDLGYKMELEYNLNYVLANTPLTLSLKAWKKSLVRKQTCREKQRLNGKSHFFRIVFLQINFDHVQLVSQWEGILHIAMHNMQYVCIFAGILTHTHIYNVYVYLWPYTYVCLYIYT